MNIVGKKIGQIMREKKISYGELAVLSNIPKSAIHRYVTGETEKIPMDRVEALAKFLNVSPAYLMGWEEEVNQLDQMLKTPKTNPNMQKRTLESVETYFSREMYQILDTMKDFDTDTQKELLKRAEELKMLEEFKK